MLQLPAMENDVDRHERSELVSTPRLLLEEFAVDRPPQSFRRRSVIENDDDDGSTVSAQLTTHFNLRASGGVDFLVLFKMNLTPGL